MLLQSILGTWVITVSTLNLAHSIYTNLLLVRPPPCPQSNGDGASFCASICAFCMVVHRPLKSLTNATSRPPSWIIDKDYDEGTATTLVVLSQYRSAEPSASGHKNALSSWSGSTTSVQVGAYYWLVLCPCVLVSHSAAHPANDFTRCSVAT